MRTPTITTARFFHRFRPGRPAFTLVETIVSLALLGMIGGSIVITFNRCMDATLDLTQRHQALEVARENMEQTLTSIKLEPGIEQGFSERYPRIHWETLIETFSEPVEGQPWARVICSASFEDAAGEEQILEFEHWLTQVKEGGADPSNQALADKEFTHQEALDYTGVDEDTFAQWIGWGLRQSADGRFIQYNLDIFIAANGAQPSEEEIDLQVDSIAELRRLDGEREEDAGDTEARDEDPEGEMDNRDLMGDQPISVPRGTGR